MHGRVCIEEISGFQTYFHIGLPYRQNKRGPAQTTPPIIFDLSHSSLQFFPVGFRSIHIKDGLTRKYGAPLFSGFRACFGRYPGFVSFAIFMHIYYPIHFIKAINTYSLLKNIIGNLVVHRITCFFVLCFGYRIIHISVIYFDLPYQYNQKRNIKQAQKQKPPQEIAEAFARPVARRSLIFRIFRRCAP